jgi:hypothetical protein
MADRQALSDRLFAERLAAPLRDSALFCGASISVDQEQVKAYVQKRSQAIGEDLFSTPAEIRFAIDGAEKQYTMAGLSTSLHVMPGTCFNITAAR